ncbi:MAG: cysteine hydrolase family protein [Burkholderiaceae bacterium]
MTQPPRRALVVIDVQQEYFTGNLLIQHPPVSRSLPNIGRAMDAAAEAGIPVAVIQHSSPATSPLFAKGSPAWELHPEVARRHRDHYIEKNFPSVFTGTDFAEWLARHEIDTLAIVGYMTHNCNASTFYEAVHRKLTVEHLHDATGSLGYANAAGRASGEEIHRVLNVVFHTLGAVASTDQWVAAVKAKEALPRGSIPASYQAAL